MIANMNHGGRVAMLGLPKDRYAIDWGRVITHMITLKGIYGREMFETWYAMGSMLATSPSLRAAVSSVVTHRYPAEQWEEAFDDDPLRRSAARSCSTGAEGFSYAVRSRPAVPVPARSSCSTVSASRRSRGRTSCPPTAPAVR